VIQNILMCVEQRDWEAVMAGCAVVCGASDQAEDMREIRTEITKGFEKVETERALLSAKYRYYDCVLSCTSPEYQAHLKPLLKGESAYLDIVRNTLRLSESRKNIGGFYYDRIHEWKILCEANEVPFLTKDILLSEFDRKGVQNDRVLFRTIAETAPLYFLRRLQVLDRDIFNRINLASNLFADRKKLRIYEYGCGCADVGIFFAANGHEVIVSEAEDGMLPLVKKRFEMRGLQAEYLGASARTPIPVASGKFDMIVVVEGLEHLRRPMDLLEHLNSLMTNESLVFLGSFPFNDTNAVGDHLKEALDVQKDLLRWIKRYWEPIKISGIGNTFRKKRKLFGIL